MLFHWNPKEITRNNHLKTEEGNGQISGAKPREKSQNSIKLCDGGLFISQRRHSLAAKSLISSSYSCLRASSAFVMMTRQDHHRKRVSSHWWMQTKTRQSSLSTDNRQIPFTQPFYFYSNKFGKTLLKDVLEKIMLLGGSWQRLQLFSTPAASWGTYPQVSRQHRTRLPFYARVYMFTSLCLRAFTAETDVTCIFFPTGVIVVAFCML